MTCKHCGRPIQGLVHTGGANTHLMRCDPADSGLPYGYNAESHEQPCASPCIGAVRGS